MGYTNILITRSVPRPMGKGEKSSALRYSQRTYCAQNWAGLLADTKEYAVSCPAEAHGLVRDRFSQLEARLECTGFRMQSPENDRVLAQSPIGCGIR